MSELYKIGRIGRTHGVQGLIRVESYADPFEKIIDYQPWFLENDSELIVLSHRIIHKTLLVEFEGYDDLDKVSLLRNYDIYTKTSFISKDGEYYWKDLIGLSVYDADNIFLGKIDSLAPTTTNDLLVIVDKKKIYYVPFIIEEVILKIDLLEKIILISWHEKDFYD